MLWSRRRVYCRANKTSKFGTKKWSFGRHTYRRYMQQLTQSTETINYYRRLLRSSDWSLALGNRATMWRVDLSRRGVRLEKYCATLVTFDVDSSTPRSRIVSQHGELVSQVNFEVGVGDHFSCSSSLKL